MHKSLLSFLLFLIAFSGCSFLRGGEEPLDGTDSFAEETMEEDDMWVEEEEDLAEEEYEEEDWGEEEDWVEEEDLEPKKGFIGRLFGGGNKESDEDLAKDYDDYETVDSQGEPDLYVEAPSEGEDGSDQEGSFAGKELEELSEVDSPSEDRPVSEEPVEQPVQRKSLNKILRTPWTKEGLLVNAVYIARTGETLSRISQTLYAQDRTEELLKINGHLKNRNVVVGDKIYYNSALRPNDNSQLLFFYEENRQNPVYYTLSPGDNIRDIAYRLLGHANSWKEIWATNPNLQSKGIVDQSIEITYWPGERPLATASPVEEVLPEAEIPSPELPPAPVLEDSSNPEMLEEEALKEPDLPKDIEAPALELPPPPEEEKSKESFISKIINKLLEDMGIFLGLVVFIAIVFLLIKTILQKRKQKDFDYTATNIEA